MNYRYYSGAEGHGGAVPYAPKTELNQLRADSHEMMIAISRAMDEIYLLRATCAQEALRVRSEEIPRARSKKRQKKLLALAEGLEAAACGHAPRVPSPQTVLKFAGASGFLNYSTWRNERE